MALTFAISALKGGVGKSTVSLNIATCLHADGHKVLIVDTDPQATCRTWAARASEQQIDGPPVVAMDGRSLSRDLAKVASNYDVVVIDTPPRMGREARASMVAADMVIVPTVPGAADIWSLQETLDVLEEARSLRPELIAAVLLNRVDRTTLARKAREAISDFAVPLLKAQLGSRVAFGEATLNGQGVVDYDAGSTAAHEVGAVCTELLATLEGQNV